MADPKRIRAKMVVDSVDTEKNVVKLSCLYDPESKEDQDFCKATPWGEIEMGIDNPVALEQFTAGKVKMVEFFDEE